MSSKNSDETLSGNRNPRITWEGCSVLLDINDGDRVLFSRLNGGAKIKIGNKNCSLQPLIGCPFGSSFQVDVGEDGPFLSRVGPASEGYNNLGEKMDCEVMEECRDNRALVDNNTAQTLTGEDIDEMRRKGVTGDEIVEALIANSATFDKKTAFSQEKYRIKKQKKYAPRILVRRPFARSICEAYFKKQGEKIGFLRVDTLSLLLSFANVTSHSDVLVLDMLDGLITGAVAERLGGMGYVCNTYCGMTPYPINIVRMFNFSNETCKKIVHASLSELQPSSRSENSTSIDQIEDDSDIGKVQNKEMSSPSTIDLVSNIESGKSIKAGDKAPLDAINSWKENGFSSLIIAAPDLDAWSIAKELVPLLSYSAPFVIYHQYLQPLATCMHNLQTEKMAISLQISESWLREYQVLPSRTHPHMQMSSSGGYLLTGIRITASEKSPA
ncbi:PREDICTED: tRNA (adenine(58)-N(1))-methyltransferase non-catalytic subunit trm6 isoform X1 [Erythranthe guttata]|uniref:tRNA (adenine(58)-N(1))-methyltransferase non-catalytic subunit trm6 isoform X1 n=1 Tax=Erythranthe guttata TaxID=4155 RepID=UPI00064DE03A|nr:PREDICTED: tRNA (adenine(58)-N(1))-methyltransferase non-catalytic subunit trm6 isoform X1 [Erythranthe guttata]|eukprot:XP_012835735.1 PREDICTED: tRNA (adenine(58)-N(1))-methyltransferase non-catalytic subunit trm6 isoform X1 [Erythranthe guttata]